MTWLPGEEDWPERTLVPFDALAVARSEAPFLDVAMELATEYGLLLELLLRSRPPTATGRDAAVLRGLAVRCLKLTRRLCAETYAGRGEMQRLLDRELFETTVDLAYLLRGGPDRFEAFLRHALAADRAVWDHLDRNAAERGGEVLPQEQRMREALERSFALAGVAPEALDPENPAPWPTLEERLAQVGEPRAAAMHQLGAFYVHGPWHELVSQHLDGADGFAPRTGWVPPRVEPVFALVIQGGRVMGAYALRQGGVVADAYRGRWLDLVRRAADADRYHELYLERAGAPGGDEREGE